MSAPERSLDEWAERFTEALLAPLRATGELLAREVDALNAELRALRADTAELGRRVDELTALAGQGDEPRPGGAGGGLAPPELVVVNTEADLPEIIGDYVDTVEDSVRYHDSAGVLHYAPADCVLVVAHAEAVELLRQAGRS